MSAKVNVFSPICKGKALIVNCPSMVTVAGSPFTVTLELGGAKNVPVKLMLSPVTVLPFTVVAAVTLAESCQGRSLLARR